MCMYLRRRMPACLFRDFIYGDPFYIRICYQTVYRLALASLDMHVAHPSGAQSRSIRAQF